MGRVRSPEQTAKRREAVKKYRRKRRQYYLAQSRERLYGISQEQWAGILEKQNGLCAICKTVPATCVDHCHVLGTVRGALCRKCNAGIGLLSDDSVRLRAAVAYLEGGYC